MAIKDITGMRSGRLVAVQPCGFILEKNGDRRAMWRCKCDCGNTTTASSQEITLKRKQSCGCLRGRKRRVVEARAVEAMKVFKENTEDFGDITAVVIDGECYFLFSEVDAVMQLGKLSKEWFVDCPACTFYSIRDGKSWRIEDVPGVGEKQLLVEMRAVRDAEDMVIRGVTCKKECEEISEADAKERIRKVARFYFFASELQRKHEDSKRLAERAEPLRQAMSAITGEEI